MGFFNGVNSKIDYAWVRAKSEQPNLFNNKYYKVLAAKPAKVKDGLCIGNAGRINRNIRSIRKNYLKVFELFFLS